MKKRKKEDTFTKRWMNRFFWAFLIWVSASYILALIGKEQIAESLSEGVVQFGIATIIVYLIRAYYDTKSEKKLEFDKLKWKKEKEEECYVEEEIEQ